jgi:hypothetical protein
MGDWLMQHRVWRVALTATLMPLLAFASAAIVMLVVLKSGWRIAAQDAALALVVAAAAAAAAGLNWLPLALVATLTWALSLAVAQLYRRGGLNLTTQVLVLLALVAAAMFLAITPDPTAFWVGILQQLQAGGGLAGMAAVPQEMLPQAAAIMTGVMAAGGLASLVASLCLGRWLAAGAVGIGGEFRQLRLGKVLGWLAVALVALLWAGWRGAAGNLLLVLGTGFVMQGLAVVHWQASTRQWPAWWAWTLYLPLLLLPAVAVAQILLLATIGLVDNVLGLRRAGTSVV